ncbi:hypothetical protein JCM3766R1_003806 [Sporobolomyces carnicolor]
MPPSRMRSIDLGMPTPTVTQDDGDSQGKGAEAILKMIKEDQARKRKEIEKQERAVLKQTNQASKKYKEAVAAIMKEGEIRMNQTIRQHQSEENRLKQEIAQAEKQVMDLLQVECSDTKLASAATMAAVEEHEKARASLVAALKQSAAALKKDGQEALDNLWMSDDEVSDRDDEYDRGDNGPRGGNVSA